MHESCSYLQKRTSFVICQLFVVAIFSQSRAKKKTVNQSKLEPELLAL